MIIQITFDGDDAEQQARDALRAAEYKCHLWDIREDVRSIRKYRPLGEEAQAIVEEIYSRILDIQPDVFNEY